MGNLDLSATLDTLRGERSRALREVAKLEKAIAAIRGLAEMNPNGRPKKRAVSAAARRKMSKAQKLRWAKFEKAKAAKA